MRSYIVGTLLLIAIGLCIAGFYLFYEKYEDQVWIGASEEAKRNPYLAAQRYLTEKGVDVVEENTELDFSELSPNDMVFLSEVDSILVSKSQIDAAMNWVERGGFLIVGVGKESQGHDSLLERFDIDPVVEDVRIEDIFLGDESEVVSPSEQMREINRQIKEAQEKEQKESPKSDSGEAPRTKVDENDSFNKQLFDLLNRDYAHEYYKVDLDDELGEIYLASLDKITLEHPLVVSRYEPGDDDENSADMHSDYEFLAEVSDENGPRLLQFSYGAGTFTALSSSELWDNDYIGLADHAFFLSYFVPDDSRLHFFYNFDVPSIWEILKQYFWELILIGAVMLVLWLWRRGLRVQREIIIVDGQRRSFAEHLHAAAKFLVGNKQYQLLLNSLKDDIEIQMRPFYPGFSQLNSQSQVTMLVERTELPEKIIQSWARYCDSVNSQDELLAALKIGNLIRKKL